MIHEMCPDGVPMVALGEVCTKITDGSHNPPAGIDCSSFRMISSQNIFNDKLVLNDIRFLNEEDFWKENRRTDVSQGDLLLTIVGAIGRCYVVKKEDLPFTCQRSVAVLKLNKTNVIPEYVHECIVNINSFLETQANGAAQKGLYLKQISKIQIPLPPLPIQQRIVEILDKFTSLVSSLDSEIALRQKQYEYYRNKLLTFEEGDEGVEWKTIGDFAYVTDYVSNGSFASLRENVHYKSEPDYAVLIRLADYSSGFDSSKFVYIDQNAYNFLEKSNLNGGEIIISNVGSCGVMFRCPKLSIRMSLAPNTIMVKSNIDDYLYYWLGSKKGQKEIMKFVSPGAMPKFNKTQFKTILVPIPPKSVQHSIVQTLDTFESLIANLKKERELRQKQYEYYREKLLTFE